MSLVDLLGPEVLAALEAVQADERVGITVMVRARKLVAVTVGPVHSGAHRAALCAAGFAPVEAVFGVYVLRGADG